MNVALLLHYTGMVLWIGPSIAVMVMAMRTDDEPLAVRGALYRMFAVIHTTLIGPGAALAVISGLVLSMRLAAAGVDISGPLVIMQATGLLGGLLVLAVSVPTAVRISRLATEAEEQERLGPTFERLRKRHAIVSSMAGVMAMTALMSAVM